MDSHLANTKVDALVISVTSAIQSGEFKPGFKLRSIRAASQRLGISRNTVVEAYSRLEAHGFVQSRPGSGYYVREQENGRNDAPFTNFTAAVDVLSLLREQIHYRNALRVGDGRPPAWWMESADVWAQLQRSRPQELLDEERGYGDPAGYRPLRETLARTLHERGVDVRAEQVLLTHGANHAMDLIVRWLLAPGDVALVDAPGYYPLFAKLTFSRVEMHGVPRQHDGPNLDVLQKLLEEHRPKVFFTQSLGHNPTGGSISLTKAHKLLQLTQQCGCLVVEDDPFAEVLAPTIPRLASLDQLENVIYVGTFSKTLSAGLRVGYMAGSMARISELCDLKMVTIIAGSDFLERMLHELISAGHYRRHIGRLRAKVQEACAQARAALETLNVKVHPSIPESYYLWIELPPHVSELEIARRAAEQGIFLAPGCVFYPNRKGAYQALRINVGYACSPDFLTFFASQTGFATPA